MKNLIKALEDKPAMTLVETMVVMAITTVIFGGIISFLIMSNNSWRIGQDRLLEQQQARRVISEISETLRQANPNWLMDDGNNYPVTLSTGQIDFYTPSFYPGCCPSSCTDNAVCQDPEEDFHTSQEIKSLVKITYRLNPVNTDRLLKAEGADPEVSIANDIESLVFSCGCTGCSTVDDSCPVVDIVVTTSRGAPYVLQSKVILRNQNIILPADTLVEEPVEGEI